MGSPTRGSRAGAALLAVAVFGAACGVSKPPGGASAPDGGGNVPGAAGTGGADSGGGFGIGAAGAGGETGGVGTASATAGAGGANMDGVVGGSSAQGGVDAGGAGGAGGKVPSTFAVDCGGVTCADGLFCIHDIPGGEVRPQYRYVCAPYPDACANAPTCNCLCPNPFNLGAAANPGCDAIGGAASCFCGGDSQGHGPVIECIGV